VSARPPVLLQKRNDSAYIGDGKSRAGTILSDRQPWSLYGSCWGYMLKWEEVVLNSSSLRFGFGDGRVR